MMDFQCFSSCFSFTRPTPIIFTSLRCDRVVFKSEAPCQLQLLECLGRRNKFGWFGSQSFKCPNFWCVCNFQEVSPGSQSRTVYITLYIPCL